MLYLYTWLEIDPADSMCYCSWLDFFRRLHRHDGDGFSMISIRFVVTAAWIFSFVGIIMTVTAFNMISIIDLCVVWLEGKWTRLFSIDGRQNPIRVVGRVHEPNVSLYIDQWRWRFAPGWWSGGISVSRMPLTVCSSSVQAWDCGSDEHMSCMHCDPWSITSMPGVGNLKRRDQSVDKKLWIRGQTG